jgi:hypothetical protein
VIPGIIVRLGDGPPVTVEPTTNGMWLATETADPAVAPTFAVLLATAYYAIVGEPAHAVSIATVRAWARDNLVRVEEADPDG